MSDQTTVARMRLARENEAQVLAEAALEGEKAVSVARIAMWLLLGLSQTVRHLEGHVAPDPIRGTASAVYGAFAVVTFFMVRRVRATPRGAARAFALNLVDLSLFVFMGVRSAQIERVVAPEIYVCALLLPLLFTISRYAAWQVAAMTAMCSLAYLGFTFVLHLSAWHVAAFVVATYLSIGFVVYQANLRVKQLFANLRKRDNLARFLAPQVVDQLMRYGDAALAPTQREATLLFSDLRDFTSLSENMEPRELLELLDAYFTDMTRIVKAYDGAVNKFIGDGMLAVWGVPEKKAEHAQLAIKAALAMRRRVVEINAVRHAAGKPPLRIGVGIHTGTVAAGMLGGADQHEYTVIGDAVNVASRIEGLNKEHGTEILASEATWARAAGKFHGEEKGAAKVKGRNEPVRVYAVHDAIAGPVSALDADAADGGAAG